MKDFIKEFQGRPRGFSLVEMAVVLVIMGLLMVFALPASTGMMENHRRDITEKKLKNIETALANYVMINKRLPCPADGEAITGVEIARDASGDCVGAGASANQATGVIPWITIGMTEADVLDGWNNQFTYRVALGLSRDTSLDMSNCDPIGNLTITAVTAGTNINVAACATSCVSSDPVNTCSRPIDFLINKGFTIRDAANNLLMDPSNRTGAAYVVISHGKNGRGAYTNSQEQIAEVAGTLEEDNYNNGQAVDPASSSITSPQFRDTPFAEGSFDDSIIHPSVITLIQQAQLGPRSH